MPQKDTSSNTPLESEKRCTWDDIALVCVRSLVTLKRTLDVPHYYKHSFPFCGDACSALEEFSVAPCDVDRSCWIIAAPQLQIWACASEFTMTSLVSTGIPDNRMAGCV